MTGIKELYLKTGTGHKKRFVPMHTTTAELGEDMAHALASIFSVSGCDSTSAFRGMGKEKRMKAVTEHPQLMDGLKGLGKDATKIAPATGSSICYFGIHDVSWTR